MFILTWITQGSNYLSAYGYGVMHRMHHFFADTEKDPHSPKYDPNPLAMMWRTKKCLSTNQQTKIAIEEKFTKNVPQWKSFDKFASSWYSRIGWGAFYTIFFIFFRILVALAIITSCIFNGSNSWNDYQLVWSHLWLCKF